MVTEIDLRDSSPREFQDRIDDAFDEIETGTEVLVISDRDIDAHLLRYQIERGRALDWAHEDPDAEPREVRVSKQEPLGDGELGTFDVRDLIPQRRHEVLLDTFNRLDLVRGSCWSMTTTRSRSTTNFDRCTAMSSTGSTRVAGRVNGASRS